MKIEHNWMELHLTGVELERSRDKENWFPIVVEEPYVGDGYYYRRKEMKDDYSEIHGVIQ